MLTLKNKKKVQRTVIALQCIVTLKYEEKEIQQLF